MTETLQGADYAAVIKSSLRAQFPTVEGRSSLRHLYGSVSNSAEVTLRDRVLANPQLIGTRETIWLMADDHVDSFVKGKIDRRLPETDRPISDEEIEWLDQLKAQKRVELRFNRQFFTSGDSREPEQGGVAGALAGSALTLLITLLLSFPVGVAAADRKSTRLNSSH